MKNPLIPIAAVIALLCTGNAFAQSKPKLTKWAVVEELVLANQILVDQGVIDAYGHVSVRDPQNPNHFLLARHIPAIARSTASVPTSWRSCIPMRPTRFPSSTSQPTQKRWTRLTLRFAV